MMKWRSIKENINILPATNYNNNNAGNVTNTNRLANKNYDGGRFFCLVYFKIQNKGILKKDNEKKLLPASNFTNKKKGYIL